MSGARYDTIHRHARLGACGLERVAVGITYHMYKTGQNKSFSSKRKRLAESLIAHANGILSDREEVNGFLRADGAPPGFFETLERLIAEAQPTVDYSDILAKNFDKQYRPLRQVVGELVEVFE